MTRTRHGSAVISLPDDLDIVVTREFEAPIELVFDVLTKPEHVTRWFFDGELRECSIDLRVGGHYHFVGLMDGLEMGFRGTFLELARPTRFVDTWLFEDRPDDEAIETVDLHEAGGVRDRMTEHGFDGLQEGYDRVEDLLRILLA